jgi:hypothetical protein
MGTDPQSLLFINSDTFETVSVGKQQTGCFVITSLHVFMESSNVFRPACSIRRLSEIESAAPEEEHDNDDQQQRVGTHGVSCSCSRVRRRDGSSTHRRMTVLN